jgi:hypothetical protein
LLYFCARVNFLRSCAWVLPCAFLAAVFTFLLTHGPSDPALAVYPFVRDWLGADRMPTSPEVGFFLEAGFLFVLPYAFWLAFVFLVSLAERSVFGKPPAGDAGAVRRAFRRVYVALVLLGAVLLTASTGTLRRKLGGNTQVGAVAVAAAPFAAGALALVPAIVLAVPAAGLGRMRG